MMGRKRENRNQQLSSRNEGRNEGTKERRNEGTKERRNEGTKERRNEGTKERRNKQCLLFGGGGRQDVPRNGNK